jgi:retron-type reverse transcriptase
LENKAHCSVAFVDISQAFDKVWHTGSLYKLKHAFPHPEYTLLKSYLTDRTFQVRYQEEYIKLYAIHSEVPQGSILSPILYSIFTSELPETEQTLTATYADDTAILASHQNPITASRQLTKSPESVRTVVKTMAHTSQ